MDKQFEVTQSHSGNITCIASHGPEATEALVDAFAPSDAEGDVLTVTINADECQDAKAVAEKLFAFLQDAGVDVK